MRIPRLPTTVPIVTSTTTTTTTTAATFVRRFARVHDVYIVRSTEAEVKEPSPSQTQFQPHQSQPQSEVNEQQQQSEMTQRNGA
ncbi:hypothetical protein K504DRAFT_462198 [Pleomassaria siparia CBS 279.74]|uniref:Uncharacterized protein n=1 Tax=Pleomassaria siparia CBS 279.74 TaxID=1314801 RepID=A0A6G1KMI2_9PLEO|nr:hypothetical protein K504DRAFT_462198 [Pleomassaria siparia CBS 279.74]